MKRFPTLFAGALLALAGAQAVHAAQDDIDVNRLNNSLDQLANDPTLGNYAQAEQGRAHDAINRLAQARSRDRAHELYLAERRVDLAKASAQLQDAQLKLTQLDREHDQILLDNSRREADRARRELERQRMQYQMAQEETARLQQQGEAYSQAAEQARNDLLTLERAARQKAEQADRAKDEFIAALSHELRTPLNAILGWMYMVRNEAIPDTAKGKAAEAVVRNAGLLARLIEDLLDTSRITTGRLELAMGPVDLRQVVQAAIESVLPASEQRGVGVVLESSDGPIPELTGDPQRLQQVVWNLLSNAIKFSSPGETVHVGVTAHDGAAVVTVRDHGNGIEAGFLPHVFERFQQADSSTARESGGLGLGLYIARHLTEMHGGSLQARSEGHGLGAEFTLRLPAGVPQASPAGWS